jgi:hypothetical protein
MAKTLLSIQDLRRRALAEIRQQPVVTPFRTSPTIALQMSVPKIIGPYVFCPRALLMRTQRPELLYVQTHAEGQLPPLTAGAQPLAVARLLRLD